MKELEVNLTMFDNIKQIIMKVYLKVLSILMRMEMSIGMREN